MLVLVGKKKNKSLGFQYKIPACKFKMLTLTLNISFVFYIVCGCGKGWVISSKFHMFIHGI